MMTSFRLAPPPYLFYPGLERRWKTVVEANSDVSLATFTVATYNVLSDEQIRLNPNLYRHLPPWILSWEYRFHHLLQEITYFKPDIVCFQEIDNNHYNTYFERHLGSQGYEGCYKRRTGDKPDGCAIFWNVRLFARHLVHPVEFKRDGIATLDRDNVALISILTTPTTHHRHALCIVNTHLLYNEKRGEIKLAQLALLLAETDRACRDFRRTHPDRHLFTILCGDLNSMPFSGIYNFIHRQRIDYHGANRTTLSGQSRRASSGEPKSSYILSYPLLPPKLLITSDCKFIEKEEEEEEGPRPLVHSFPFVSVYGHVSERGNPEVTTYLLKGTQETVDYIFYTPHSFPRRPGNDEGECYLRANAKRALIERDALCYHGYLPNVYMPSDHQLLQAQFSIVSRRRTYRGRGRGWSRKRDT